VAKSLKDEIIEQVDHLDDPRRRQVLDFARQLASASGTPGRDLLRFKGLITQADLDAMSKAIEEHCEAVDPNGW